MSEFVEAMIEKIESFNQRYDRVNKIPYVMAKHGRYYYRSGINPTDDGRAIIEGLSDSYLDDLRECHDNVDVIDWDEEGTEDCIFYKPFLAEENLFFENERTYDRVNFSRFLKKGYKYRFFCIEIPLSRTESIHLFQKVTTGYDTTNKIHIPLFERRNRIHISDHTTGFTIQEKFDFATFFERTNVNNCYTIVKRRKPFEQLFGYIERYQEAFESVSKFPYINFTLLGNGSEDLWRKCHSLLHFPDLNHCIAEFTKELRSGEQTLSKRALDSKQISYIINREGIPVVTPQNLRQSKHVIRILKDGIAETHYCKNYIIAKSYARI